jgi:predicted metalloprotease with PDZ domain
VMRFVYHEYYQKKKRGFTDLEFRNACEKIAGASLADEFEYVTTTREIDYPKYFSYAGLIIDTTTKELPGAYIGLNTRERNDSVFITTVDYGSPAWNAGIRPRQPLLEINGVHATSQLLKQSIEKANAGDKMSFTVYAESATMKIECVLGKKRQKTFTISRNDNPSPLQKSIYQSVFVN